MARTGAAESLDAPIMANAQDGGVVIERLLRAVREHLGLDAGFVSQFVDGERVLRFVDAAGGVSAVRVGDRDPVEESYCHYVVSGVLPELLPDARRHPVASRLPVTDHAGTGTLVSVPIRFSDGRVYGTFCCFGFGVNASLAEPDLRAARMLAELAGEYLEALDAEERDQRHRRDAIDALLRDPTALTMAYQPLVDLATGQTVALEALARFPTTGQGPEQVFAEAWAVGAGVALEMRAVDAALADLNRIPAHLRLGVNVSPGTLVSPEFEAVARSVQAGRIAVEVTEHVAVDDYRALQAAREQLVVLGMRLAIDDVGIGVSGLRHILEVDPDTIKIDSSVVRDVDTHPAKAAMVQALVSFAEAIDVLVIAEGIETEAELTTLKRLGVNVGQGFHLARPGPLDVVLGALWQN